MSASTPSSLTTPTLNWLQGDQPRQALWRSEAGVPAPAKVVLADDTLNADAAYKLVCEGTALLWQGDYHQARQMLQALARRVDRKRSARTPASPKEAFHQHRQRQAHKARVLGLLLLPFEAGHTLPLRRAPDVREACQAVWGPASEPYVASLRELQGLIGAHEWRKSGVEIPALQGRIHAHYGVFSPVRGEYVDLVAQAPLPAGAQALAFDIGVGSGVLSAVLAHRGVQRVVATDQDLRALACARANLTQLGLIDRVDLQQVDLFPAGRAPLVVCNPPWVPANPSAPIEHAVYDPDSRMLKGFLAGLRAHLSEGGDTGGEGWLILSDLAEHLGLRSREELMGWVSAAGLKVLGRLDAQPRHPKATDPDDPLHQARSKEVTSLWRLGAA
jgi:methylase of polypeptide subunit release factors